MSKQLIIAEKPSVAKDIAKALGGFKNETEFLESSDRVITWAVGHLVEFIDPEEIDAKYKAWKLEDLPILPSPFKLRAKDKCGARIKVISKLMKRSDVDALVNACDAGREGELIFRELVSFCKCKKPILRLWLQSMTQDSIRRAFENLRPGEEYENLYEAAQCRSEADWLIGINATRALTRRLKTRQEKTSWSAGRVQTPTLAMLQSHELDILKFRSAPYWTLQASFSVPPASSADGKASEYTASWFDPDYKNRKDAEGEEPDEKKTGTARDTRIFDKEQADRIRTACLGQPGLASEVSEIKKTSAYRLFDLTTLQREANSRFGFSAKTTLAAAQSLYESHKLITYPRTSSKCLPTDYTGPVKQLFEMLASQKDRPADGTLNFPLYAQAAADLSSCDFKPFFGKIFNNKEISDHFALIPTLNKPSKPLREPEAKVYDLIVRRFLAAFMPPLIERKITRITKITAGGEEYCFKVNDTISVDEGWRKVYGRDSREKKSTLKELLAGSDTHPVEVCSEDIEEQEKMTNPPSRINESRLLSLMENAGNNAAKNIDDEELHSAMKDMGLGTPATRAEIIEALLSRGYAERADRGLKVTTKGIILIDMLNRIDCLRLASPELTGQMEQHLNQVEHGEYKRSRYMKDITEYTRDIVDKAKDFEYDALYKDEEPIGTCPVCGRKVCEQMRFYACEGNTGKKDGDGCQFIIWKEKNGRYIDSRTMHELLEKRETPLLEGFKGTGLKTYRGILRLKNDGTLELESENGTISESETELPASNEAVGTCPYDDGCRVIETPSAYVCEQTCVQKGRHKKGFSLPRIICKRQMSLEELGDILTKGRTELLDNFISKYNKPFKGYVVRRDETGRYAFEFAPRAGRGAAKADAETAGTAAKAEPAAEAPKKRTTRAAAKKDADAGTAAEAPKKRTTRTAAKKAAEAGPAAEAPKKRTARSTAKKAAEAGTAAEAPKKRTARSTAKKAAEDEAAAEAPKKRTARSTAKKAADSVPDIIDSYVPDSDEDAHIQALMEQDGAPF